MSSLNKVAANALPEMLRFDQFGKWRKQLIQHPFLKGSAECSDIYVRNKLKAQGYAAIWETALGGPFTAMLACGLREILEAGNNKDQVRAIGAAFTASRKKFFG